LGAAIIIGAGLYIFLRERDLGRETNSIVVPAKRSASRDP
jgi:hypothetical protein